MLESAVLPEVLSLKYITNSFDRCPHQVTIKYHKTEYHIIMKNIYKM